MKKLTILYPFALVVAVALFMASCSKSSDGPTKYRLLRVSDNEGDSSALGYVNTYELSYTADNKLAAVNFISTNFGLAGYTKNFSYTGDLTIITTTVPTDPRTEIDTLVYSLGLLSQVNSINGTSHHRSVYHYNLANQLFSIVDTTNTDSVSYTYTNGDITGSSTVHNFVVAAGGYQYTDNTYAFGDYIGLTDFLNYGIMRTPTAHLLRNVTTNSPSGTTTVTATYVYDNGTGNISQVTVVKNVNNNSNSLITHVYNLTYQSY